MRICSRFVRRGASPPRIVLLALLLGCGAASVPARLEAQVPATVVASDTLQEIRLADGSTFFGRVTEVAGERITVETTAGVRVELQRGQIRSLRPVRGRVQGGEVWLDDPHATRLFFAPTGRPLDAGEGYFGVFELFLPFVSYGITNQITIAGGTPILPGAIGRIFYLAPKVTVVKTPRTQLAGGVLAFFATGLDEDIDLGTAGLLYGVGTFGSRDGAVTVGAALPFYAAEGDSDIGSDPLVMLGGEARIGRRVKLISENYFVLGESGGLVSAGLRFFGERLSADAGLGLGVGDGDSSCCVPLVNFVYSFGGRR
jgi:hypothetical protein